MCILLTGEDIIAPRGYNFLVQIKGGSQYYYRELSDIAYALGRTVEITGPVIIDKVTREGVGKINLISSGTLSIN